MLRRFLNTPARRKNQYTRRILATPNITSPANAARVEALVKALQQEILLNTLLNEFTKRGLHGQAGSMYKKRKNRYNREQAQRRQMGPAANALVRQAQAEVATERQLRGNLGLLRQYQQFPRVPSSHLNRRR